MNRKRVLLIALIPVFVLLIVSMIDSYFKLARMQEERRLIQSLISQTETRLAETISLSGKYFSAPHKYSFKEYQITVVKFDSSFNELKAILTNLSKEDTTSSLFKLLTAEVYHHNLALTRVLETINQPTEQPELNPEITLELGTILAESDDLLREIKKAYLSFIYTEDESMKTDRLVRIIMSIILFISLSIWIIVFLLRNEKYQKKLILSEEKYKNIVNFSPLGIVHYNAEGIVTDCNQRFYSIVGTKRDTLLGLELFNELTDEKAINAIRDSLITGKGFFEDFYKSASSNKETYIRGHFNGIYNDNDEIVGGVGIIEDISYRKEYEEKLVATQERYETFINETHEGIYRMGFKDPIPMYLSPEEQAKLYYKNGFIAECNKAFARMYQAESPGVFIGKTIAELHDLDSFPGNFDQTVDFVKNKYRVENQVTIEKDQKGVTHYFSNNALGIIQDGHLLELWGTQIDITKQVEAEEERKILYRAVEQSQVSIVITDTLGNIEYINPKFEKVTGYSYDEVIGKNPRFLKSGYDYESNYKQLWAAITSGKTWSGIFHNKKKDGTLFFESANISPIVDDDGKIRHFVAVKEDITELREAQNELNNYKDYLEELVEQRTAELKNRNIFLRTLIDTIPNPVFVKNSEGKFTDVNKAFIEMFGRSFNEIIGRDTYFLENRENEITKVENYNKKLLESFGKIVYETSIRNKHDEKIPIMVYKASFGPEGGKPEGIAALLVDISASKKTQEQMQKALEQQKELNEMKTNFISLASHELRTPLTAIYSSTELIEKYGRKWNEEKFLEHISRIKFSVDNLTDLMEDLLTLSRVDTGKIVFSPHSFNLRTFVTNNVKSLEPLKTNSHNLVVNINLKNDYYILDERLLKYIIQNLLSNSLKYSPGGGEVKLEVFEDNDKINIIVKDQGMGISPEDMKNLYEPFHRGKNSALISGTGLGLSIVKEAVALHKGEINVASEINKGTRFEISLPVIK